MPKAIIIVPGVMGTELELSSTQNGLASGTKVWPPYQEGDAIDSSVVKKLTMIKCNNNGESVYNLRVRNNNFGALNDYETLYTELNNSYHSTHDVIFFAYDWRKPNSESGNLLRSKINEYDSVVIVAHSMGGLVTSHMLKNISIRSKVDKVITLGTPYLGSLEMLPVMSFGHFNYIDIALSDLPKPVAWIAKEGLLYPQLQAISVNIPSLYELLPTKKFFSLGDRHYYSIKDLLGIQNFTTFEDTRFWFPKSPGNSIGEFNLNLFDNATTRHDSLWNSNTHVTSNVNTYYIAGENQNTMRTYTFNQVLTSYSTTSVAAGDGTVLSYSATMNDIYSSKSFFVNANHSNIVKFNGSGNNPNIIGFIKNLINGNTSTTNTDINSTPNITP